jgi:hypothetical protein
MLERTLRRLKLSSLLDGKTVGRHYAGPGRALSMASAATK